MIDTQPSFGNRRSQSREQAPHSVARLLLLNLDPTPSLCAFTSPHLPLLGVSISSSIYESFGVFEGRWKAVGAIKRIICAGKNIQHGQRSGEVNA